MPVINVDDLTDLDKAKMEVTQLKTEVKLERAKVSKCCEEVMEYIQSLVEEDTLVKGIAEDKNPFKDLKGGCVIS
ncbi:guanine nucleotide-binding protein G(T) subunit gamma-T1 [Denticeps clupeoides]|uniref:Guanine nucleotide-binding protein subunit gamma n=1 Tax=Denticeps clupeoides TaxID=299321 RepID=A0AAY4E803_9TELE|nr:guanine nucleotide-binding protein G(T) subunit gamma-T1-like [Denticeps clupeoides]